jgi:hypothetical protein
MTRKTRMIRLQRNIALYGAGVLAMLASAGCPESLGLGGATAVNGARSGTGARSTSKPTVSAPADQTVECDGNGNKTELDAWLNSATFTEGCGGATLANDHKALGSGCGATGSITVTWTVTDDCDNTASDSARFTVVDTTDPTLTVPNPITVTCGEPGTADALTAWLASATATDVCGGATITSERAATPGNCTATIIWTATDECGNALSLSSTYTTSGDTTAPTMSLNGDAALTIECGDAWQDPGATIGDDCDALIRPTVTGQVDLHTPGVYVLTYAALDACGNAGPTFTRTVTVVDTTPPVVELRATKELWPPNHKMDTLTLADLATITDACEGELDANAVAKILDIYCDEPDDDTGDGSTTGDIAISNDFTFSVRVERSGSGNGRVYGIRFEVSDSSGNTVEATATVHVPHDQSGRTAVDDGAVSGQVVTR